MKSFLLVVFTLVSCTGSTSGSGDAGIRALEGAYVDAWTSDRPDDVMATFADDAILVPSGHAPIGGKDAMRAYWWPDDGSTTTITHYSTTIERIERSGDLATYWGRGNLSFVWSKDGVDSALDNQSTFTAVARRGPDGSWKMIYRAWSALR